MIEFLIFGSLKKREVLPPLRYVAFLYDTLRLLTWSVVHPGGWSFCSSLCGTLERLVLNFNGRCLAIGVYIALARSFRPNGQDAAVRNSASVVLC